MLASSADFKVNGADFKANENPSKSVKVEELLSPSIMPMPVQGIVADYLDGDIEDKPLSGNRFNIFGSNIIKRRAEALARDFIISAAPLDALEAEIKKTPLALLPQVKVSFKIGGEEIVLRGTLEQLARMQCDLTVVTENGFVVPGCAETLRGLRQDLLPKTIDEAVVEAKQVTVHEDKENAIHLVKLNEAFNLVRDKKEGAGEIIKKYIKSLKPEVIVNDRYFFDVLQLLVMAFGVLQQDIVN